MRRSVLLLVLAGCGPHQPPPELPPDGGVNPCAEVDAAACQPPQTAPLGTYQGTITLKSWSGADTSTCEHDAPTGTTLGLYVRVADGFVTERGFPCDVTSTDPQDYRFSCTNHALDEACTDQSIYWDPTAKNCDAYYERREFALTFTRDATSTVGSLVDTRNWGGCSVRVWDVSFVQRPIP